jgi:hypothetical protein
MSTLEQHDTYKLNQQPSTRIISVYRELDRRLLLCKYCVYTHGHITTSDLFGQKHKQSRYGVLEKARRAVGRAYHPKMDHAIRCWLTTGWRVTSPWYLGRVRENFFITTPLSPPAQNARSCEMPAFFTRHLRGQRLPTRPA